MNELIEKIVESLLKAYRPIGEWCYTREDHKLVIKHIYDLIEPQIRADTLKKVELWFLEHCDKLNGDCEVLNCEYYNNDCHANIFRDCKAWQEVKCGNDIK